MKIMHLTKSYPPVVGDDAIVVSQLEKQQLHAGHQVVIVTANCDDIPDDPRIHKVGLPGPSEEQGTDAARRLVSLVLLFVRMFAILRRERPDVLHAHSLDMAICASFAARLFGVPMVHSFHLVTFFDPHQSPLRRKAKLWLAKHAGFYRVTAPNRHDVQRLRAAGLKQTVLLPNGVDLLFWKIDERSPAEQPFVFVAVGRLERQKGYSHLLHAAALLAQTNPGEFKVLIAGEGSQETVLRNLAHTLKLEDVVSFVGHQSPLEIRKLLAKAGAMVLPSLYETTPTALLEAWAVGVPVIATSVGILQGLPENFGGAVLVPPQDEHELMEAMQHLLTTPLTCLATAAEGHDEVQQYAWPAIARTADDIYHGIDEDYSLVA